MMHYLLCAPLWLICSQALQVEAPITLGERIGVVRPSVENLQLLALCFQVYHYTKSRTKELGGFFRVGSCHVQRIAFEAARTYRTHVK